MDKDIIELSKSAWAVQIVFAPKYNKTLRFWIDFLTSECHYTQGSIQPVTNERLPRLHDNSQVLLYSGLHLDFWHITFVAEDRQKVVLTTHAATLQYKCKPFTLYNALATHQRTLDRLLIFLGVLLLLYLSVVSKPAAWLERGVGKLYTLVAKHRTQ